MQGRVLNKRYELIEKIGEGGMALTWRGKDRLLERPVAVKVMREGLQTDAAFTGRFHQEARAAANLSHKHIAAVYDFGSDEGLHYIVMEYVPGEDLRRRIKRQGRLSVAEALDIASQVAEALEAAHSKGIVHRDIKPANILLGPSGEVKVADFGIARVAAAAEDTSTGVLLGSVHYLSPEQARGEAVGPQADLYALGVVMFEMLTGRPPLLASNPVAVIHKHIYDPPPLLHSLRPEIPVELEGIVGRCLAKSLSDRYATARELLNYLRALRARVSGATPMTVVPPPGKRRERRRLRRRVATVTAAVCLLAAAAWGLFQTQQAKGIAVPALVGMDIPSARAVVEGMGLRLEQAEGVHSASVQEGRIVSQFPSANEKVGRDSLVQVQVSRGREKVQMPEVTEMTEGQARRRLEEAGLRVGAVREQESDTSPAGIVLATEPAAGAEVTADQAVVVVVSKGLEKPAPGPGPVAPVSPDTVTYTVPANTSPSPAEVIVEISDGDTRSIIYQGRHGPGESIPPQKIPPGKAATVRIRLNGRLVEERSFGG